MCIRDSPNADDDPNVYANLNPDNNTDTDNNSDSYNHSHPYADPDWHSDTDTYSDGSTAYGHASPASSNGTRGAAIAYTCADFGARYRGRAYAYSHPGA